MTTITINPTMPATSIPLQQSLVTSKSFGGPDGSEGQNSPWKEDN